VRDVEIFAATALRQAKAKVPDRLRKKPHVRDALRELKVKAKAKQEAQHAAQTEPPAKAEDAS
jgi:hypothetical protein